MRHPTPRAEMKTITWWLVPKKLLVIEAGDAWFVFLGLTGLNIVNSLSLTPSDTGLRIFTPDTGFSHKIQHFRTNCNFLDQGWNWLLWETFALFSGILSHTSLEQFLDFLDPQLDRIVVTNFLDWCLESRLVFTPKHRESRFLFSQTELGKDYFLLRKLEFAQELLANFGRTRLEKNAIIEMNLEHRWDRLKKNNRKREIIIAMLSDHLFASRNVLKTLLLTCKVFWKVRRCFIPLGMSLEHRKCVIYGYLKQDIAQIGQWRVRLPHT